MMKILTTRMIPMQSKMVTMRSLIDPGSKVFLYVLAVGRTNLDLNDDTDFTFPTLHLSDKLSEK